MFFFPFCYTVLPSVCVTASQLNYYSPSYLIPQRQSPFPPVNTQKFDMSARQFQKLMEQVQLFINKIVSSSQFARDLMNAAQNSDQKKVEEMIRNTDIDIHFQVSFTPTAIRIIFDNSSDQYECCQLLVGLQW